MNRTRSRFVLLPMAKTACVWGSAIVLAALLFVACGGSGRPSSAPPPSSPSTSTAPPEDAKVTAADFKNIHSMTPVDDHFVANVRGHLPEALAVARSKAGGTYPVGTILQFLPTEAMVKRRAGFSPATNDWEFFTLKVSPKGTEIVTRGGAEIVNMFNHTSCASCHAAAKGKFDMVCGKTHGCAPLGVSDALIQAIQASDPRPR
jgi:hypothetical protein